MNHEAKPVPQHSPDPGHQAGRAGWHCNECGGRLIRTEENGYAHAHRICAVCSEPIKPHHATFWRHVAPPTYPGEGKGGAA